MANISADCENMKHNDCDGRIWRGSIWQRCDCECHLEGVLAGAIRAPSQMPPMEEALT